MSHRSRLLAAVLLVAALAVPASLQASGLPSPRTAALDGGSLLRASSWSLDGLLRMVRKALIDEGPILDPNGGASAAPPPGNSGDGGPSLDPSGRANAPGRHVTTHRRHGH
ncbi:MAG TPA: hypothetical protein VOA80_01630 [Thermoanaerobaculia bacterium]|nr:hypothetical protein [Thermoanaerobaculia bacterium]